MAEEINFGSSALAEYVTDANEILEFKLVSSLELKGWSNHAKKHTYVVSFVRFGIPKLTLLEC